MLYITYAHGMYMVYNAVRNSAIYTINKIELMDNNKQDIRQRPFGNIIKIHCQYCVRNATYSDA